MNATRTMFAFLCCMLTAGMLHGQQPQGAFRQAQNAQRPDVTGGNFNPDGPLTLQEAQVLRQQGPGAVQALKQRIPRGLREPGRLIPEEQAMLQRQGPGAVAAFQDRLPQIRRGLEAIHDEFDEQAEQNELDLAEEDQHLSGLGPVFSSGGFGGQFANGFSPAAVTSSVLNGTANLINSAGHYNRNTAVGEVYHEKAVEAAIQNRAAAVNQYFAVRQANRQLRNAERGPHPTAADMYRYSRMDIPDRPNVAELSPRLGQITWPAVLQRPEFAAQRERMERLFETRTFYNSGVSSANYVEVKDAMHEFLAVLRDHVKLIDPTAYVEAKNFLQSLGYEARFVAEREGLAKN